MSTTWEQLAAEASSDASALEPLADAIWEAGPVAIRELLASLLPHPTHVYVVHYMHFMSGVFKDRELAKEYAQQLLTANPRLMGCVDVSCVPWQTMLNSSDGFVCDRYQFVNQRIQHEVFK